MSRQVVAGEGSAEDEAQASGHQVEDALSTVRFEAAQQGERSNGSNQKGEGAMDALIGRKVVREDC